MTKCRRVQNARYAFVRQYVNRGIELAFRTDLSQRHLAGYLEGATDLRWSELQLKNGIPERLRDQHHQLRPYNAIDRRSLERLLDVAELRTLYPTL